MQLAYRVTVTGNTLLPVIDGSILGQIACGCRMSRQSGAQAGTGGGAGMPMTQVSHPHLVLRIPTSPLTSSSQSSRQAPHPHTPRLILTRSSSSPHPQNPHLVLATSNPSSPHPLTSSSNLILTSSSSHTAWSFETLMAKASVEQRCLLGWPVPGHRYWSAANLAAETGGTGRLGSTRSRIPCGRNSEAAQGCELS